MVCSGGSSSSSGKPTRCPAATRVGCMQARTHNCTCWRSAVCTHNGLGTAVLAEAAAVVAAAPLAAVSHCCQSHWTGCPQFCPCHVRAPMLCAAKAAAADPLHGHSHAKTVLSSPEIFAAARKEDISGRSLHLASMPASLHQTQQTHRFDVGGWPFVWGWGPRPAAVLAVNSTAQHRAAALTDEGGCSLSGWRMACLNRLPCLLP